jgi:hypothetical protein
MWLREIVTKVLIDPIMRTRTRHFVARTTLHVTICFQIFNVVMLRLWSCMVRFTARFSHWPGSGSSSLPLPMGVRGPIRVNCLHNRIISWIYTLELFLRNCGILQEGYTASQHTRLERETFIWHLSIVLASLFKIITFRNDYRFRHRAKKIWKTYNSFGSLVQCVYLGTQQLGIHSFFIWRHK